MSEKADLSNASLNVLLTINGKLHLVAMDEEKYETLLTLTKCSAGYVIPTNKTQKEFNEFIGYKG